MNLSGPTPGLGTKTYSIADGVTAVQGRNGTTLILGVRDATYNPSNEQHEALINPYHLMHMGYDLCVTPQSLHGNQMLNLEEDILDLDYDESRYLMTAPCRKPTQEEISSNNIIWLTDSCSANTIARRRSTAVETPSLVDPTTPEPVQDEPEMVATEPTTGLNWEKNLGYPSKEVLDKTLDSTTQLCGAPVEMEKRLLPKQHRKPRILPLHPRRLKGRTDTDTFFSSIPSIRGYKCVQLFVAATYNFLFIRCLQRERQSHTGYQDYIREVGAPEVLLADNSKTQNGKKWTTTSRQYAVKQRNSVAHNQNQNGAEKKVGELKSKTVHALKVSGAPLVFWCYCMKFIVDCMNYTASSRTGWRTPIELLNGDTPDITMFRYEFWQPVEVYDNVAPFPTHKMIDARFIGIAWESGDAFTYRVWTEPGGVWKNGQELIRNVVRPRTISTSKADSAVKYENFKLMKKVRSKKSNARKRKRDPSPKRSDNDLLQDQDMQDIDTLLHSEEDDNDNAPASSVPVLPNQLDTSIASTLDSDETSYLGDVEMTGEINDHFSPVDNDDTIGGARVTSIVGNRWKDGHFQFKVTWSTNEDTWESYSDLKLDHPRLLAGYINTHASKIQRNKRRTEPCITWATKTYRDLNRAVRRLIRDFHFEFDDHEDIKCVRRTAKTNNKKRKSYRAETFKYGVKVPRNVKEALKFDDDNNNTYWWDAIRKEMKSLEDLN